MVDEQVPEQDKYEKLKKFLKFFIMSLIIIGLLIGAYFLGFSSKQIKTEIVVENPLNNIISANTDETGGLNREAVINQGILEFNQDYINYILVALGVTNLKKSVLGFGNPIIEFALDQEIWSSEINNGNLITKKGANENKDINIIISKKEAVEALLSYDIRQFMKDSVVSGDTKIEMLASKPELLSKGYLDMYSQLTSG